MPGHAGYAQAGSGQSLSGITCLKGVIDTIQEPYDFRDMFKKSTPLSARRRWKTIIRASSKKRS